MLQPLPKAPPAPKDYTPTGAELWSYDQAWGPDVVTALRARHCFHRCLLVLHRSTVLRPLLKDI
jgi:hypothetical protein